MMLPKCPFLREVGPPGNSWLILTTTVQNAGTHLVLKVKLETIETVHVTA